MDYTILALESSINDMKIIREHLQERMRDESEFILGCLEAGMIVMEADSTKPSVIDKITKTMKAFFEKIKGLFRTKAVEQAKKHTDWIKVNRDNIAKLANTLTVEVLPFWDGNYNDQMRIIKATVDGAIRNIQNKKFTHDYATKIISTKYVTDKNVIEYLKNFYRIGERDQLNLKQVKLTGKELASKVEDMIKYTVDYVGIAVPAVNQTSDHIVKAMEKVGKTIGTVTKTDTKFKISTESYMFVEEALVRETDLVSCINYTSVMEAEEKPEPNKPEEKKKTEITNSDGETTSATNVGVVSDDESNKDNNTPKVDKPEKSQEEIDFINEVTGFIKLVFSAFTTVMEERYIMYVNLLRSIGNADTKTIKTDEPTEGNNTEDNTNTDNTTDPKPKKKGGKIRSFFKGKPKDTKNK